MICGIDEAGRGPLAGPVCAAAVILNKDFPRYMLNDSKKLSPLKRDELQRKICVEAFAWGVGWASHIEIDSINILQASLLAMKRAFEEMMKRAAEKKVLLSYKDVEVIVDGLQVPDIGVACRAVVKADEKFPEVMAASILAKTERDTYMEEMGRLYPKYGYETHKGYPTQAHRDAILKYGPSPIQRMSFNVK